jgi:hypothetical protein
MHADSNWEVTSISISSRPVHCEPIPRTGQKLQPREKSARASWFLLHIFVNSPVMSSSPLQSVSLVLWSNRALLSAVWISYVKNAFELMF